MDLVQDYEELERLLFPERTGDGPESFSGECCICTQYVTQLNHFSRNLFILS